MITIDLNPNIVTIGAFTLAWHGVFSAVGIIVGIWLTTRLLKGSEISEDDVFTLALWAVIAGIIGARLFHVVDAWAYYSQDLGRTLNINEGGLSIYGAIVAGTLATVLALLIKKMPVGRFLDAGAAGLVLGQAIGRIGDIINGEHHGIPTDWPIGVRYIHPDTLGEVGKRVHLAVGYEMFWDLIILAILLRFRNRLFGSGMAFALYTVLYAAGRFVISFARVDNQVLLGLSQAQIVAAIIFVLSVPMVVWMARRTARQQVSGIAVT